MPHVKQNGNSGCSCYSHLHPACSLLLSPSTSWAPHEPDRISELVSVTQPSAHSLSAVEWSGITLHRAKIPRGGLDAMGSEWGNGKYWGTNALGWKGSSYLGAMAEEGSLLVRRDYRETPEWLLCHLKGYFFKSLNYNNSFSSSGFLCCALLYRRDASKQRISPKLQWKWVAVFASITVFSLFCCEDFSHVSPRQV